ncbi:HTH-type transcriptional regulator RcdA [Leucobacter aridicollis]|uniref:TetR/AcrR family transcriptional regulator n=1 Tax=Leucobacter aridicollis TaxID=283878 RepID=UPI00216A6E47|nr:TetR family transcriptional regulator [Leucobacter aridicollis]MCS3426400.1 DNA-binding transcriptional regulator YbjK [Leucobacter aridicollis]
MSIEPLAPGRRDPEGRRRAILRAATEIIVTRGAAALTHRAVASHAGVSLGSTTQYFSSIEELREEALRELAQEDDEALAALEPHLATLQTDPSGAVTELLSYLQDPRAVNADIALFSSATADPSLRELALRWSDKLIEMLSVHFDRDRAEAIAVYIDGATIHAGLRQHSLSREALTLALTALAGTPTSPQPTSTTGHPSEKSEL